MGHMTRFLRGVLTLLLLRQHRQSNLEGIGCCSLAGDLVLGGLVDGLQERLVHCGGLYSLLQLGIRLLEVGLQVGHAVESLHQGLGGGHLLLFERLVFLSGFGV